MTEDRSDPGFNIRNARLADWDSLEHIWVQSKTYHEGLSDLDWGFAPNYLEVWKKWHDKSVRSRNQCSLLAESNGVPIGLLIGNINKRAEDMIVEREGHIELLMVDEPHRSKGVGTALVESFFDWAREKGLALASLYVFAPNDGAISFYRKFGFEILGHYQRLTLE